MIGNTVETDLVGETVEVVSRDDGTPRVTARGRVRAVTAQGNGYMVLWVERIDLTRHSEAHDYYGGGAIGDIVYVSCGYSAVIRLVRSEA